MANFENIDKLLEGTLASRINEARSGQHVWEWYNALKRIMSANYVTGVCNVYGPATVADSDFVAVNTDTDSRLFGALVDNSNSGEDVWVTVLDGAASDTPGTEHTPGALLWVERNLMQTFIWPRGLLYDTTGIALFAGTGTDAGLEGGTGVTGTNPTIILVYTA
jgi:hypothetical protein